MNQQQKGTTMSTPKTAYPCTGRPACGGTARLTFEPGGYRPDGDFIGDRAIYVCDTCGRQWNEYGQALHNYRAPEADDD